MEALSEPEIRNLNVKAKIHGWSQEQIEKEKQKLIDYNLKFAEPEEELDEKARSAGFKNYAEQKAAALVKKMEGETYDVEKVLAPPPMVKKIQALEFTEPEIPGEIKIDTSGRLLKTFFEYEGQIGSLIDQYNNFITNTLAEQIYSKSLTIPKGEITFENIILNRPLQKDITGTMKPLYPQEARTSGYSYTADIYVDMVLNKDSMGEERLDKIFLGKVPVMLGSELDWITGKSPEERGKLGEGLNDPFGYFIIKGSEKIILIQEKLRANRFFIFNSNNKGDVVCKITNNTLAGSSQITMVKGKKKGALKVHLGFMGRLNAPQSNKLGKTMPVLQIYRMLGITDPKEILNYIFLFTKPENVKKMFVALQPSLVKFSKIGDDIEYISKKKGLGDLDYEIRKADIMRDLLNQLFPQISVENIQGKIYMLSIMTVRLLEYLIGVRKLDDRDNWGNKQLVTAGKSLELLFASIWRETTAFIQKEIDEKKLNGLAPVKASLRPAFITDNFIESFTANNWGVQSANSYMKKENITDILKRDSVLSVYSHLTKINTPGSTQVKTSKIRMVQMSQLGYVDAGETPEGQLCGLSKNASMTCYSSLDRPEEIVIEFVAKYVSNLPTDSQKNPFMLNGVFMGWVNGEELEPIARNMKTSLKLPKDTCIVLEADGFFNIYTDAARPTRPLLLVDTDGRLVIEKKNLWNADFDTLLREGCVEYVDAWEQENIMLAQKLEDIDYRQRDIEMALNYVKEAQEKISNTQKYIDEEDEKNDKMMLSQAEAALKELTDLQPYTHSEIDPTATMSIAIGIIPLPETNPGPRLTYQAGMGKQSLGIYHSNHSIRFDTTSKLLAYPSRPMFETQFNEIIGLNELPAGETVILAISTYSGFAQEDAIVMAKSAIDRGLFRSVVYKTYKSVLKPNERFTRPEVRKGLEDKYSAIDENGLPRLGAFVKEGDAIIGKIRVSSSTGKTEDVSSYVEVKQEGVIDRVLVSTNAENNRVVKVKIRQIRKPVMGDKFASRYAQKGTIGMILPDEDMPFTADGVRPDLIINPHCFPKDTPVSTHKGYAKRIGDFSIEGGEDVWCWNLEEKTFKVSQSAGMESKGVKKLIKVYLEDGREIKCTPDHRFLTLSENGEYNWVEAKDLKSCKVVCGLEMPLDKPEEDFGQEWSLQSADYTFDMSTPLNREKSLAFARILGYTLTDGCISKRDDLIHGYASTLNMGHDIDAQSVQDDIFLITGKRPKYTLHKGTINIRLPASLSGAIGKLPGVQNGKRVGQAITIPEFLNYPDCPNSILREFLGGLFGGDGCAPRMIVRENKRDAPLLNQCGFVQTSYEEHKEDLVRKMENISDLLRKVGVETSRIDGPQKKSFSENSHDSKDGIPRVICTIQLKNNSDFATKIGFRYCIQKSCRLSAACAYWRYQEEIVRQHDLVVKRTNEIYESGEVRQHTNKKSVPKSLEMARKELKDREPVINEYYSLSNVTDIHNRRNKTGGSANSLSKFLYNDKTNMMDVKTFFDKLGCLHWFERKDKAVMDYIVKRDSFEIPSFNLDVIAIFDAGEEEVFDIGVHDQHNFLAHGTVVHNCMPSRMTIGKMIEIVTSKVAAFTGERVNATAFRRFDVKEFMRNLKEYGYSSSGKERMYSGFTGKPLEAMIFTGPCYYQALRHQVADKIQMRARGQLSQLTHQPVEGRKRGGGLRVGEMERDALISHGASAFLRERLCLVSDAYETVFCSTCGTMAISNVVEEKYICRNCDERAVFGTCTVPYSFKLLTQLLAGANFQTRFKMREVPK